ncbi:MAG: hypothetical protein KBC69_00215 [Candidatus Magasanikbacteria bacterium]|nr:hypothetical protein [Candidatus Magasanikbacteria bacterium]
MSTKESGGGDGFGKVLEFKAPPSPSNQNFSADKIPARISAIEVARNKRDKEKNARQMSLVELLEKAGDLLPEITVYDRSVYEKQIGYFRDQVSHEELTKLVREIIIDKNKIQNNPAVAKALVFTFIMQAKDLNK